MAGGLNWVSLGDLAAGGCRRCRGEGMQVRSPQARFALLVRGEVWRWGCDELGRAAQRSCSASLVTHFISPLEAAGHRVDVFLALDIRRAAPSHHNYENAVRDPQALSRVISRDLGLF